MFSWLSPSCPVSPWEKAWVEYRFAWLMEKLGRSQLLATHVVLPTDDFFPEIYSGTLTDAQRLLAQLARHMQINPARVTLEVLPDDDLPDAAGHYDATDETRCPVIRVAESQLKDPEALIATLAHELAHEILLGGKLLTGEEWDHEWVTDLLPVFYGLGAFAANVTIREKVDRMGRYAEWSAQRMGYLNSRVLGYAMAVFLYAREETRAQWKGMLRLDARAAMTGGWRYLERTGDCYLNPRRLAERYELSPSEVHDCLRRGSNSMKIIALWEMNPGDVEAIPLAQKLLRHRHQDVRMTAAHAIARFGPLAQPVVRELQASLRDSDERVRTESARTLGVLQLEPKSSVVELSLILSDEASEVVQAAAAALVAFGREAAVGEKFVLAALHRALIDCNDQLAAGLVNTLRHTVADPGQSINDYFRERDPEFRHIAIDALYNVNDIIYEEEGTSIPDEYRDEHYS